MKVNVNKDICIGCGACQVIADKVFELGDDGYANAKVEIVEDNDKEDVIDASEGCPVGAIEITEE